MNDLSQFTVTEAAMRPASSQLQCFYCQQPIGGHHKQDCILISKKVLVRMIVEYEVDMPACYGKEEVEFQRNESSWCANNAIDELREITADGACLCGVTEYEYIKDASEPYLQEE
jgi:hypothetical protein